MQQVKVSIVVPVYNVAAYLPRCLDAISCQTLRDVEVLLVDDGSRDESGAICDAYAAKDARFHVFHKANGGLSDARNFGLARATGEYVQFVDSDDWIEPDACEQLLQDTPADMVIGSVQCVVPSSAMARFERIAQERFTCHKAYTGKAYLMGCLQGGALRVDAWRNLFRRAFLVENHLQFQVGIAHEDEEFTPRALLAAQCVKLTDKAFYHYENCRTGSIMNSDALKEKKAQDRLMIYNAQLAAYRHVTPRKLRRLLEDDLSWKYIDAYRACGNAALVNRFRPLACAWHWKRRLKALVFAINPCLPARHGR